MPYADPEKRREVKRKYEQEKRKQRRTNWMLVFYEDQCPEWREELDELGMPTLVSPSHDADEWTERDEEKNPKHKAGTLKEPHRHLLAMYDNPVSYDQVVKDFAFLKSKNVKYVKSLPAMARYLTHMDSPDKARPGGRLRVRRRGLARLVRHDFGQAPGAAGDARVHPGEQRRGLLPVLGLVRRAQR